MASRIQQLQEFLTQTPNDCFLKHALALELVKEADETQAEQYFRANLEADPSYLATYYHLGKLLERTGREEAAMVMYEKGMEIAKMAKDMHTYNELQSAYEDLAY